MPSRREVYGPGGFDPRKPNNNVIEEEEYEESPKFLRQRASRVAVKNYIDSVRNSGGVGRGPINDLSEAVTRIRELEDIVYKLTFYILSDGDDANQI